MRARREAVVNEISATKLGEILELRIFLELHCARLAAHRATEGQLQSMERLLAGSTRLQDVDLEGLIDIDRRFHRLLYAAADNAFMVDILERLYDLSLPLWQVMHSRVDDGRLWIEQYRIRHRRVVDALREGDEMKAATLVEQHLIEFQQGIAAVV
jgi:DNA-binding GntR family transcriptional regulator